MQTGPSRGSAPHPIASPRPVGVGIATLVLSLAGLPVLVAAAPSAEGIFVEPPAEAGFDFVHFNGMTGEYYFPEMTGAGCAFLDYDGDGDQDMYILQGHLLGPEKTLDQAIYPPVHPLPLTDRLYRNDTYLDEEGRVVLAFTDVTESAGIETTGYGMGVATGDVDNDGWVDLYVTNYGSNNLLRNNGDGTFTDATASAGVDDTRWTVSAAFLDYDRDGWLDLYVGNYVTFSLSIPKVCSRPTGARDYCGPLAYDPQPDRLFRNRGDGTFEDASVKAGIHGVFGGALGVVSADFNGDGWTDIYVANDGVPNLLWINQRDGTFLDDAMLAGCSVNREGQPEASMGVDAADVDGDGDVDLFMAHLTGETNTLYLNDGQGFFLDQTLLTGLGAPSWTFTSFGTLWLDYDNDGLLDLLTVNGAVKTIEDLAQKQDVYPLHQTNQIFRNLGESRFREVTAEAGSVFELSEVSRGAALADVDNDGDQDVLVANNAGPARLLVNQVGQEARWIGVRPVGATRPGYVTGTRVGVPLGDGATLWRRSRTDGSYASAHDPRVLVGLGPVGELAEIRIVPLGAAGARLLDPPVGRYLTVPVSIGEPGSAGRAAGESR